MKILQVGDMHLQDRKPVGRTDDYWETQLEKLNEVVHIANDNDCPIVCAGDLFNSHFISDRLKTAFGEIISQLEHDFYFAWGNHDSEYHSSELWDKTSLGAITANNQKVKHISQFEQDHGVKWDWIDWNCEPVINGGKFLLTHKAVYNSKLSGGKNGWIEKDKTFGFPVSHKLLKNYDLILCGHWHKQYVFQHKLIRVFNSGALLRKTVDILDDPAVYIIDLETFKHKKVLLDSAKPYSEVMSKKHIKLKNLISEEDQKGLVEAIANSEGGKSNFIEKLNSILLSDELDSDVVLVLNEIIAELIEKGAIKK